MPVDRATLHTPDDATVLLALGRLHKAKALDVLLEAVSMVPGVYLWIAGEGPDRATLEALCTKLGLDDRVRFLGWRDDRAALFSSVDVCVFPSRYEPFGTVFVQAWAQRVPLVTADSDGPKQYVRDGEDGLMVPIDDAAALAEAIRRVTMDTDLCARMTEKGFQRYQAEFTKINTVSQYLAYYHEMLKTEGLTAVV